MKRIQLGRSALCALVLISGCDGGDGKHGNAPAPSAQESACSDGIDNDHDGQVDCRGLDCPIAGGSCSLAPPLDRSVASTLGEAAAFLYSGSDPLQREADPKAFDVRRIALLRGQVVDRAGDALAGVRVSISAHPEYGYTF